MDTIDDEWDRYCNDSDNVFKQDETDSSTGELAVPICQDLYISTTTKVLYLNQPIDIDTIFWKLPVINYGDPKCGIVKKQMKISSKTPEDFEEYKKNLTNWTYYKEHVIKQIHNPNARRIKFKDERKITIGVSKKDIMNCRGKVKNAFYNCFAIILRMKYNSNFKEIHVKVFNTGKLEIPGILNAELLDSIKTMVIDLISPYVNSHLSYVDSETNENVLINSNFNCGYFINRDKLYDILKSDKYKLETAYDPCSYPGVKCKFYFNNKEEFNSVKQKGLIHDVDKNMKLSELDENKKYTEISFMIFRTGSVLIVGNCTERILRFVYDFIKKMLQDEYLNVYAPGICEPTKVKKEKIRKKQIKVTNEYYNNNVLNTNRFV
tara:strand:+ start:4353 stop:5486 length:1134 start_codon:yes stop_codon:yes gene_type:complete